MSESELESLLFDGAGEETEEELVFDISKSNQAVIWGTDWTTETIARQLEKGIIDLNPNFQRRDAWTDQEKSKLIESLMLGFPVPPIILAENRNRKNSFIVIDGKQRLLSIRRFYSQNTEKILHESGETEKTVFKQLKLKGLEILSEFNGLSYSDVQKKDRDYVDSLDNQSIRTVVIKNWPDEAFLYTVFLRLNTGSKKLTPQELRQALHSGAFLTYLDEATADSVIIRKMLNNAGPDPRMKDIELALRYFAFKNFPEVYSGSMKEFLDEACKRLNKLWEKRKEDYQSAFFQLEQAIQFASDIFSPQQPFFKYVKGSPVSRFNRTIFEILVFYFSIPDVRLALNHKKEEFKRAFVQLNDDPEFSNAVSETTKTINRVVLRYSRICDIITQVLGNQTRISLPVFQAQDNRIIVENRAI